MSYTNRLIGSVVSVSFMLVCTGNRVSIAQVAGAPPQCKVVSAKASEVTITPPADELPMIVRSLSGIWEGTLGPDPLWLIVETIEASKARVFYGGSVSVSGRSYRARPEAQVSPEGKLQWERSDIGKYSLAIAGDQQHVTGSFASSLGYGTSSISLTRCTLK